MPNRDGTGPQWGSGPKTGNRHGECGNAKNSSPPEHVNKSQSLIATIGSAITLVFSIVKLFSSKDKDVNRKIS
jgi:hypothetical protein